MKSIFLLAALVLAAPAFAQTTANGTSTSNGTAVVDGGTVNSPLVQLNNAGNPAVTSATVTQKGLPVATPGTAFTNQGAADTCVNPGDSAAVQLKFLGIVGSKGGEMQVPCDVRARAINAKVTGRSATFIAMTQCQDPNSAAATEDEADLLDNNARAEQQKTGTPFVPAFRCPDRLRPQWVKDKAAQEARASAILNGQPDPAPVAARPMPWQAGG